MAFVEFKIIDKRFFGKTAEQITAVLQEGAKKAREIKERGGFDPSKQEISKFPKWVREIMNDCAIKAHSKAKWDSANDTFSVRIAGTMLDAEDFYKDFETAYGKELKSDEAKAAWANENPVRAHITESDGSMEMADLEGHNRGAAVHPGRVTKDAD